jgi:hypothetical protein
MPDLQFVNFDRAKLERLKTARDAAILHGHTAFTFEGACWLVDYAKYVIEYLEARLPH